MERLMMEFKERVLTALNHEEPDRVPVMGLIAEPATSNRILGKQAGDLVGMLTNPELKNQIKDIVNSTWQDLIYGNFADALEAAIKLGFDANWTTYTLMRVHEDPEAKLGWIFHDIWGRAWEITADENGDIVVNYIRGLCTTEEEWDAWVESKKPLYDELIRGVTDFHKGLADNYSDRILPIGYTSVGIFEIAWQQMGFVNFTRYVYQKPDFVKKVIDFQTDLYIKYLDAIMKSGGDVVIGEDDLGQKTGPLMRPELIEKLFGDSYRRVSELVHKQNKKLIWHSCGNIYAFLDKFVEWGFDGLLTMEPTAGMELGRVREQVGHKLVLVGNLDVSYLLVRGTREEIEEAVKKAIRDAARGGGYILAQSHTHRFVDPTRLAWMIEAAHKYGKYPITV
jgi:uroporphyrinogen-III decarboxylase